MLAKWKIKVAIQFVLAHLPFSERLNHLMQRVYRGRGGWEQDIRDRLPEVCDSLKLIDGCVRLDGAEVVEVGTGWIPFPTVMLFLCGARRVHTFDHLRHARFDLTVRMLGILRENLGLIAERAGVPEATLRERLDRLAPAEDLDGLFALAGARYHAPADATATGLPDGSVDLFYSHAVLEHVPEPVVHGLTREAKRVLKPGGCVYHLIGLHDHYACVDRSISKVHFLQHSDRAWNLFVQNDISYHNRMREREFVEIFEQYGAKVVKVNHTCDPADVDRVRAMTLNPRFARFTPEENAVTLSEVVATFPGPAGQ